MLGFGLWRGWLGVSRVWCGWRICGGGRRVRVSMRGFLVSGGGFIWVFGMMRVRGLGVDIFGNRYHWRADTANGLIIIFE